MTFKRFSHWFQNSFWYHYKWRVVGLLCAVLSVVFVVVSLTNRERPDFTYALAVDGLSANLPMDEWNGKAEAALVDLDGDGRVYIYGFLLGFDDTEAGMANRIKFAAEMSDDELLLLVLDDATLAGMKETEGWADALLPLAELGLPSEADSPFLLRVEPPVSLRRYGVESDFYLCVKALTPEKRARERTQALYEQAAAFARIITGVS